MTARIKLTVILALAALLFAMAGGVQAQEPPPNLDDPEVVKNLAGKVFSADDRALEASKLSDEQLAAVLKHTYSSELSDGETAELLAWAKNSIRWAIDNPAEWAVIQPQLKAAEGDVLDTSALFNAPDGLLASTSCATHTRTAEDYGRTGDPKWHYRSSTYCCWDGVSIASEPLFQVNAYIPGPGW